MGNVGLGELLVIALVALLVFGPDRLPELARQAGKALATFRRETSRSVDELKRAADLQDLDHEVRKVRTDLRRVKRDVTAAVTGGRGRSDAEPLPPVDDVVPDPPPVDLDAT